jgi:hypothetical protein
MSFSRWKLMAGVLGVSLGGLAALAGQCPKSDATKTARQAPDLSSKVEAPTIPTVPAAGMGSAPQVPPPAPSLPAPPMIPAPSAEVPAIPPPAPTKAPELPPMPLPAQPAASEPAKKPDIMPPASLPMPPALPVIPASGTAPQATPPAPAPDLSKPSTAPTTIELKPAPTSPSTLPTSPAPSQDPLIKPPASTGSIPPAPANTNSVTTPPLSFEEPAPKLSPTGGVTGITTVAAAVPSKYRILLRVGEGEPTFEVRTGDDLLLKVVCEKVDIKSPEKGNGPSAVTARGKVRFAGFGAEGTCQELSFQAGSGEVSMTGDVKIQVKDKLGRVESELSTASVKYKIDPGTVGGSLKP